MVGETDGTISDGRAFLRGAGLENELGLFWEPVAQPSISLDRGGLGMTGLNSRVDADSLAT
jgi:hypothetical protein